MDNKNIDKNTVIVVAKALQELRDQVVFVGGAVIGFYADDPAADTIRPTEDIDLTIQITGIPAWAKMQDRLLELGFSPDSQGNVICRYLYQQIPVDIMPSEDSHFGPTNRWYRPGFKYLKNISLEDESIKILSAPYFIATKLEAFNSRGGDHRFSHDFEDFIYVIDNRMNVVEEVLGADNLVKEFIKAELIKILANPYLEEIVKSHLNPFFLDERYKMVLDKIKQITG